MINITKEWSKKWFEYNTEYKKVLNMNAGEEKEKKIKFY